MAPSGINVTVKLSEYRPCIVNDKKALFHKWNEFCNVVPEELTIGGRPAGQIKYTLGLVEYEDGTIGEVAPYKIKFLDADTLFRENTAFFKED